MEILNNIWLALSTPNEGLLNILFMPMMFLESTLVMYLAIYLLNIKSNKSQKLLFVILLSISGLISLALIPEPFNAFVNYILGFIIAYFVFKLSIVKAILTIIIPTVINALVGTLLLNPFVKIINLEYNIAQFIPIYRIPYVLLNYFVLFIITRFLKNKHIYWNTIDNLDSKSKIVLIVNFLLGLLVFSIQAIIIAFYSSNLPIIISFLSFISLMVYIVISIYSLTRVTKLTLTKRKLENAEEYNKTLQILHDSVRGFKHDYDNTVATIGGFIKTNDMDGLKEYYKELEDEVIKVSSLYMLNPNIINNPGVYSLLATKYHKADELNIKINLTVLLDLNTINMKIYDFTKILGILLDNSIDAAKECEDKIINITFKLDEKNNRQLLIIENTYLNKDIDINKIFEKGITSKENHTGLGLWEIRRILKRNNNLNLHTSKNDTYFSQQFEIYKV